MRGSRTLLFTLGAVASAGLLVELATPAAGFTLSGSSGSGSGSSSSTSGVPSPTATTTTTTSATAEQISEALFALAAGGKTLGGPGTFVAGVDGEERIYQALTGGSPNLCVTVRNLSSGQIRITANSATSTDVDAGLTLTSCLAQPFLIDLRCRQGAACQAVWRIDRQ